MVVTLRPRESAELRRDRVRPERLGPERSEQTVIIKMKEPLGVSGAVRGALGASRSAMGLDVASALSLPAMPELAGLLQNGYIAGISPVFPTTPSVVAGLAARGGASVVGRSSASAGGAATATAARAASAAPTDTRAERFKLCEVKVERGTNPSDLARYLREMGDRIEYAFVPQVRYPMAKSPSRSRRGTATLSDPLASRQWNHNAVKIHEARKAGGFRDAQEIKVCVVDSGIDATHPDLVNSIDSYENFLSDAEGDNDYKGHGTHCAGIIAAEMNNAIGVAGLCMSPLVICKALPKRGGAWNAKKYYQALGHAIDAGARVVSLSLGGSHDPGEEDVIRDLLAAGIVVVAAMGNEYEEGNPTSYPAGQDGVIAVGATDEADRRANFSCTGKHIALVAPGVNILSTVPTHPCELTQTTHYDAWPGTSMATPHVAAAAALLLSKSPNLTPENVHRKLTQSADRVPGQTERNDSYGAGRLNISKALA
jgi:subtilisin family serine protease